MDMKTNLRLLFLCILVLASNAFAQQEATKFDEMGQVNCEDAQARLDNLAIQLQQDPAAQVYVIFYGGKSYQNTVYNKRTRRYITVQLLPRRGEAKLRMAAWVSYLIANRGLDASRIVIIDGGYRENPMTEFWIAPPGAKAPTLTPTLTEKEIKFRKGKVRVSELRCEV